METLKTVVHRYRFDTSNETEQIAYRELVRKLRIDHRLFACVELNDPYGKNKVVEGEIELETKVLFSDQWNTSEKSPNNPHYRVFDWYQPIYPNARIKEGYYLDVTKEMEQIRQSTLVCGYCGHQYRGFNLTFCDACLDSPYLKEDQLFMLRLLPVAAHNPRRPALSDAERDDLMPRYVHRQTVGRDSRAVQRRAEAREQVNREFNLTIEHATIKHAGFTWLLDRNIETENCIYYDHTGVFTFGWLHPITSAEVRDKLRNLLKDFPFPFVLESERKY